MKAKEIFFSSAAAFFLTAAAAYYFLTYGVMVSETVYSGSKECARCHEAVYGKWKKTPHARALISATEAGLLKEKPDLDSRHLSIGETSSVAFAIGSHWTRRYLLSNKTVSPYLYSIAAGEFSDYYDENYKRSDYTRECIGCHVTGAALKPSGDGYETAYSEPGVACEACHGPGSAHIAMSDTSLIVNPRKISPEKRDMICMACHTNGYDKSGEYKFPLGYKPGRDLASYFTNMVPKPGQIKYNIQNRFDYAADNSIEDRKRQFEYWKYMFLSREGLSCEDCLDFRGAIPQKETSDRPFAKSVEKNKPEFFTINEYCMSCHASLPPFLQYASKPRGGEKISTTCDFINKNMELGEKNPGLSCVKCHRSESVHDHYHIIESVRE